MRFFLLIVLFPAILLSTDAPISSLGRIRPYSAYAKDWLLEIYGAPSIKNEHKSLLPVPAASAEEFLWALHLLGHEPFNSFPLFNVEGKRMTYNELKNKSLSEPLLSRVKFYEQMGVFLERSEASLHSSGIDMKMLPGRWGLWIPLKALRVLEENPSAYSDEAFLQIQDVYLKLCRAIKNDYPEAAFLEKKLTDLLMSHYRLIAGKPLIKGSPPLPTLFQLKTESFYSGMPWLASVIALYCISFFLFIFRYRRASWVFCSAFALHTFVLIMHCIILGRPPVSNMQETLIFVPWASAAISWFVYRRTAFALSAAAAFILLTLNYFTFGNFDLKTIEPVLNSQFWLTIHVLMVVGSYGAFILSGLIAHFYLVAHLFRRVPHLPKIILQSMYMGTALLITGTVLGGVWAAQSWGRFWDWDPKESWAFISSAAYLVCIHAYRYGKIGQIGLAAGSIICLQAITFTWYGVNYILGVGLHSYGFGNGGELYYTLFTCFEFIFVTFLLFFHQKRQNLRHKSLS